MGRIGEGLDYPRTVPTTRTSTLLAATAVAVTLVLLVVDAPAQALPPSPVPAASPSPSADGSVGPSPSGAPSASGQVPVSASPSAAGTSTAPAVSPSNDNPSNGSPSTGAGRAAAEQSPTESGSPSPSPSPDAVTLTAAGSWSALRASALTGTVNPADPGPISVAVQTLAGTVWTTRSTVTANSAGRFATTWTPTAPGTLTWRAVATRPDNSVLVSATVSVAVLAQINIAVTAVLASDVAYSYRTGCPVAPSSLRRISMNYWDFNGQLQRGVLIGASWTANDYVYVFNKIFAAHFPLRRVRPTDFYYYGVSSRSAASDLNSMAADNTSAFNCRKVTGNPYRISRHSWGDAIDINTLENPYLTGSRVYPTRGRLFLNRHRYQKGMIVSSTVVAIAMRRIGWHWGAYFSQPDYQHFSRTGQ